jgi:glucose-6-phosphate 1-dehydrogenase
MHSLLYVFVNEILFCFIIKQIDQVPYSVPRITFEKPFGHRCETDFIEYLSVHLHYFTLLKN